ncbi:DUF6600 domain-containing protein [Paucibacter sp. R3-3]|uniref:DUF6600 domain-containing protein n=1 Tax=Roseateles agri TaxID=3098619 RepID=A0ABU5DNB5_9BURK|nr:DUF6600 domain-containing protein [Paucibacter sp. R3-3]MDY0747820.1 DUF6600 domain-containing protein [Paucibacter sp. R3-3]
MKAATRSPAFPFLAGLFLGLVLLCQAMLAHAQPDDVDPPARAARVGEVVGDAWLYDGENREWIRLLRNQTLGQGDRVRTDDRARVSLRIGSTSLWLDERSDIAFNQLDEGRTVLELAHGDIGLRLRSSESATDTRIRTREGDMVPEREGLYRVEQLDDDSASRAYVWQGRLRFEPARGEGDIPPTWLQGGEQAEFWWAGGPRVERQRLASDGFGDWIAAQRDADAVLAQRYVSPEMTGIEDLDRNGRWEQAPDYGAVWIPTAVAPDWAPYRDGHWVWSRNWGWTWVDDAPWGFAPFHYGRWVSYRGRWCWAPGTYVARPVYAPALVAWVGGGSFSVSVNVGGGRPPPPRFGWYPLAPREVYRPPYRHSPIYGDRINGGDRRGDGPRGNGRPPQSNLNVAGAVSFLPGQGGPVRALPPGEVRQLRPMPVPVAAPSRQDFARVLPQRPSTEVRTQAEMPAWRGRGGDNNRGPDRGDRGDRGFDRDRGDPRQGGQAGQPGRGRDSETPRPAMPNPQAQQQDAQRAQQERQQQQQQRQMMERQQRDRQQQADRAQQEQQRQQREQQQQQADRAQRDRAQQQQQPQERAQQEQRGQQERQNQMERQNQERARAAEAQQRQQQERAQQQQQERAQQEQQRAQQEQQRQNQMERQNQDRARAAEAQQQQQRQQQQAQQPQQQRPQPQAQPQPAQQPRRDEGDRGRRDDGDRRGRQPQQQDK